VPKIPARHRRLVANLTSVTVVGASTAVLLVSPVAAPLAAAAAAPGSTLRASITDGGSQVQSGFDNHASAMSADGNHVAFVSFAQNIDPSLGTGQQNNVYVRNLRTGHTTMISRGTPPPPPDVPRFGPAKLLDLAAPAKQAAAQPAPVEVPPNGSSDDPALSADGRYVAFSTNAENIGRSASGGAKIVVCDRDPDGNGVFDEPRANLPRYFCFGVSGRIGSSTYAVTPKLSADAGRIVWQENQFGEGVSFRLRTVLLRGDNGVIGPPPQSAITGVNSQIGDNDFIFVRDQFDPAISGDGNHIVMHATYDQNCDCDGRFHAIVSTDVSNTQSFGRVTRVDLDGTADNVPNPVSHNNDEFVMRPSVSFDGKVIAFVGEQFFTDDNGNTRSAFDQPNVYVVNVDYVKDGNPVTATTIVSKDKNGTFADGELPAVSADGRYVSFVTDSPGMHDGVDGAPVENSCINPPPDDIGLTGKRPLNLAAALPPQRPSQRTTCQVVIRDLTLEGRKPRLAATLVSPNQQGDAGNDNSVPHRTRSSAPSVSSDGSRIAYDSAASDLIANDTNKAIDAFVRTLEPTLQGGPLDFKKVELGQPITRTVTMTEFGNGPLFVQSVALSGLNAGDFAIAGQTCQGQTLHQTGTCSVSVTFDPKAEGVRQGQLSFLFRGGRRATANLLGEGTVQPVPRGPVFSQNPTALDFGNRLLLSNGPESTVTITNTGDQPLTITAVTPVGVNPADYTVSGNTCQTVAPAGQCRVSVKFSPRLPGARPATLQFTDNAGGPHLVGLTGSGNQPTLTVNPGVAPPGQVVSVIGRDFPPGKTVTVKFDGRIGQSTVVAAADGTFRTPLLIFPKATPESRTVLGTVVGFTDPLAKGPLLIVFPTVSPAEFVVRH
jgi:hypothetical protein